MNKKQRDFWRDKIAETFFLGEYKFYVTSAMEILENVWTEGHDEGWEEGSNASEEDDPCAIKGVFDLDNTE